MQRDPFLTARILEIANLEESENFDLHLLPGPSAFSGARRLVVIVHPGDALDEPGIDDCLESMTAELRERIVCEDDILVVHRFSTSYILGFEDARHAEREWFDTIRDLPARTVHIYGDQLDQVIAHISGLAQGNEHADLLVTGLWGDKDHGCAAEVSRGLRELGLPAELSKHSPKAEMRMMDEPD